MIRVTNVTHHYGVHPVLRAADLAVETGAVTPVPG